MDVDNKEKDILILVEGSTQRLDNTILTAEAKYLISFTKSRKKNYIKSTLLYIYIFFYSCLFLQNNKTIHKLKAYKKSKITHITPQTNI